MNDFKSYHLYIIIFLLKAQCGQFKIGFEARSEGHEILFKYCQKHLQFTYTIFQQTAGIKFGPMEMAAICQFFVASQGGQHPQLELDVSTQKIRYEF